MKISLGVPPGPNVPALAARAEALGYDRIWLFDSPALYEDIWIHLALIAECTERIGIGTAVLVPSLRHVMTTASAILTIERLAPGRLACAVGTGYTARMVMGKKALSWATTRAWIEQLQGLLRGEVVQIDGNRCQLIHREELAIQRPVSVPILLSAWGPKGVAITREIAGGWMGSEPIPEGFDWAVQMVNGAVLAPGETANARTAIEGVGPYHAQIYHDVWESDPASLSEVTGGPEWIAQIESERPPEERHLAVHSGHLSHLSVADRKALEAHDGEIPWYAWVCGKEETLEKARAAEAGGATELLYLPAGDNLIELAERFHDAVSPVQG